MDNEIKRVGLVVNMMVGATWVQAKIEGVVRFVALALANTVIGLSGLAFGLEARTTVVGMIFASVAMAVYAFQDSFALSKGYDLSKSMMTLPEKIYVESTMDAIVEASEAGSVWPNQKED